MAIEVTLLKTVDLLVEALKSYVRKRKRTTALVVDMEQRERLVSEAIRELLSRRPNIHAARARIEEARLLGNTATEHLLRAEEMLDTAVKSVATAKKRAPVRKKKAAARPAVKRKSVRKRGPKKGR